MQDFSNLYPQVLPIVMKARKQYFIQLWDYNDWIQEGQICLFLLLEDFPQLALPENKSQLLIFFKTKFTNLVKDNIRKQEAKKRRLNRLQYEEISEVAYKIKDDSMQTDDYIAYLQIIHSLINNKGVTVHDKIDKIILGQRFKGKADFIIELKELFKDFF